MLADEVVILAGGLGTRLRSMVSDLPKPLAPVAGRPFLAWLLDAYAERGFRRVILATGYLGHKIESIVGSRWGNLEVSYSREDRLLGTGGALKQAALQLQGEWMHVTNGDTYLDFSPSEMERAVLSTGSLIAVALAVVPDVGRYGEVETRDGHIVRFREKEGRGIGLINAGSYLLHQSALSHFSTESAFSFEEMILEPLTREGRVTYIDNTSNFIDIGIPDDYLKATSVLSRRKIHRE